MKANSEHMRKFLRHAMEGGKCLEMRIFRATLERSGYITPADRYTSTYSGWYNNPESLIIDAEKARGVNVFVTLNPVNPALLGRANNKLIRSKNATTDDDIVCLRWLYIDIDPVRPADISSTDDELGLAIQKRDLILYENPEMAKDCLSGVSGNGAFIFAKFDDCPNDKSSRKMLADTVNYFAKKYSDDRVKVDPTTKNPARVTVLPGTWKCKGDALPDRPHRQSYIDKGGDDAV